MKCVRAHNTVVSCRAKALVEEDRSDFANESRKVRHSGLTDWSRQSHMGNGIKNWKPRGGGDFSPFHYVGR